MKHARVAYAGAIHEASEDAGRLRLGSGELLEASEAVWLPPFEVQTIFAVGLNYADHAQELAFKPQQEPLIFLKGPGTLAGHRARTRRPAVKFMHYECELAVVIGRPARNVSRAEAYHYVAGYTVANDYAIRDHLENYYRPNFRAKNWDAATLLGPWLVDAADVPDPMNLKLQTRVNGEVTQQGTTAKMVFDVPFLIEYLSAFMTLGPGDVILTGTPEGVVNVRPGDQVLTEVEGIGELLSFIVEDTADAA
ncbi:MAG: fumarylacetoacetate hydrolase family protein [Steroidobacteraceae bacterium]|jgi:5-oxopent-3-ene-1,2,5-tricarboxylate decarboxylase/2-hydroxyhepta-2,4-diene-1,7-dioate isomerase